MELCNLKMKEQKCFHNVAIVAWRPTINKVAGNYGAPTACKTLG